jgi:hypothetical protein
LDNDGKRPPKEEEINQKLIQQSVERLEKCGKNVITITPPLLEGQHKTDFNDILKAQGVKGIESVMIDGLPDQHKSKHLVQYLIEFKQPLPDKAIQKTPESSVNTQTTHLSNTKQRIIQKER